MLALAQKLHDDYVAEGQKARERLIGEGQAKYDEFVSSGKAKHDALIADAEALITEAQEKGTRALQQLDSERSLLQKKVEDLRTLERNHRAHLKSYIEGQLIELEQTGADETG